MSRKEIRELIKALIAQGFTVSPTRNGHYTVRDRNGGYVTTISGTPSDYRATKNAIARLRRAGFVWPRGR